MKTFTKTLLAVLVAGFIISTLLYAKAEATQINGSIGFAGAVNFDTLSFALAGYRSYRSWVDPS